MRPLAGLAALTCSLALGFAACGDDDDETTTTTTATAGATGATGDDGASGTTGEGDFQPKACPGADSPPNITKVIAYGADCAAVEDAMAQIGSVSKQFDLGDFSCERTSGSALAGVWTCKGEAAYFTFEFGD